MKALFSLTMTVKVTVTSIHRTVFVIVIKKKETIFFI